MIKQHRSGLVPIFSLLATVNAAGGERAADFLSVAVAAAAERLASLQLRALGVGDGGGGHGGGGERDEDDLDQLHGEGFGLR